MPLAKSCAPEHHALWKRLVNFELDDPAASYAFTDRLAVENRWTLTYAKRAVVEYKRFVFLQAVSGSPCTPSLDVDQVWHLHLVYTRSYWEGMCEQILNAPLHHGPTPGGEDAAANYEDFYQHTLDAYALFFGQTAPQDIWPPVKERFTNTRLVWVNSAKHWILRRPFQR